MRPLIKAALVAIMLTAAPVWAHGGHGDWSKGNPHHHRYWREGHHKPYWHHRHRHETRRVEHIYRYEPYPIQSASVEPGIHVTFPDVYLPWPE